MYEISGAQRAGGLLVSLSGILHLIAPAIGGVTGFALGLLAIGVVYIAMGALITRGWRSLAYPAFLCALFGGIAAMAISFGGMGGIPAWWGLSVWIIDWIAAAALFVALWVSRPERL